MEEYGLHIRVWTVPRLIQLIILVFLCSKGIIWPLIKLVQHNPAFQYTIWFSALVTIAQLLFVGFPILLIGGRNGIDLLRAQLRLQLLHTKSIVIALITGAATAVYPLLHGLVILQQALGPPQVLNVLLAFPRALVEEMLFRGVIYPAVRGKYTMVPAMIITTVAFILLHRAQVDRLLTYIMINAFLCWLRELTASSWLCGFVHWAHNVAALSLHNTPVE